MANTNDLLQQSLQQITEAQQNVNKLYEKELNNQQNR